MTALREAISKFTDHYRRIGAAYSRPQFNYLALKEGSQLRLLTGRIFLHSSPTEPEYAQFESESLVAGHTKLADTKLDLRYVAAAVESGCISSPHGDISIAGAPSFGQEHFHPEGLRNQSRLGVMSIFAEHFGPAFSHAELDWALRASNPPYESLVELATQYRLGVPDPQSWQLQIVAGAVGYVEYSSPFSGETVTPTVTLDQSLHTDSVGVGLRVQARGEVVDRRYLSGQELTWKKGDGTWIGTVSLSVPRASLVQAFLSYDGMGLHYGWLTDPSTSLNPRRAVLEEFDPKLTILHELLSSEPGRGRTGSAIDLERAAASLAWLLGFSPIHLGADQRLSEAVDVVAVSPGGHFIVMECTTGLLKAQNKLANLIARTSKVREALDRSGNMNAKLYSVIATSRTRDYIKAELTAAADHGVIVLDRSDLFQALEARSAMWPQPERLLAEAESALASRGTRGGSPVT